MPFFANLADLFKGGAVAIAEQFVRGLTKVKNFSQIMEEKYGGNFQVSEPETSEFLDRVIQASTAAKQVDFGVSPNIESIPLWTASGTPGDYIHTGLASLTVNAGQTGGNFSTHIPFTLHEREILERNAILNRIRQALESGAEGEGDFYQPDIDRLEQAIRYHSNKQADLDVDAELYSIFIGE